MITFRQQLDQPIAARPASTIRGGSAIQQRMIRWALGRYPAAGLGGLPPVDIVLPQDGCGGTIAFFRAGRISVCTGPSSTPFARKVAVHELAHAWTEANVSAATQVRFLDLRGLSMSNDADVPWPERGWEQAAEIIAWGVGEGILQPSLPGDRSEASLLQAHHPSDRRSRSHQSQPSQPLGRLLFHRAILPRDE